MSINIILENKDTFPNNIGIIERVTKSNNDSYLVKGIDNPNFPCLSNVELDDYSVFDIRDMDALTKELLQVREEVKNSEDKAHIDEIIRLAKKCKEMPGTVLTFT